MCHYEIYFNKYENFTREFAYILSCSIWGFFFWYDKYISLFWDFILSPQCFLSIWCISCVRSLFYSHSSSFCRYFINSWFAAQAQINTHGGTANSITEGEQRGFLWSRFHTKLCHLPTVLPSLEICQTNNMSTWGQVNVVPNSSVQTQRTWSNASSANSH